MRLDQKMNKQYINCVMATQKLTSGSDIQAYLETYLEIYQRASRKKGILT